MFRFLILMVLIAASTGCAVKSPEPGAGSSPTSAATASPVTPAVTVPSMVPLDERSLALPSGLRIEEHILQEAPTTEPLRFTPPDVSEMHITEHIPFPERDYFEGGFFNRSAGLGPDRLTATQLFTVTTTAAQVESHQVSVVVKRNGQDLITVPAGVASPRNPLQGLWTYGEHWALEVLSTERSFPAPGVISDEATGEIYVDGISLNQSKLYEESFGFQTIDGRPFYFFKRDGQIGIWFDGQETPLGYTEIPHYNCCSSAVLNPRSYQNNVAFFARSGEKWYYVEIWVSAGG